MSSFLIPASRPRERGSWIYRRSERARLDPFRAESRSDPAAPNPSRRRATGRLSGSADICQTNRTPRRTGWERARASGIVARDGLGRCWIGWLRRSRWAGLEPETSGGCRAGREPGQAGHVGDQIGQAEPGGGARQADRADDQASRHFWAAKTCSIATRTRALLALPRTICDGIRRPRGFGRWNWGTNPRRASNATLAAER